MANKTIYGCYDYSTGKVLFEGEACDESNYEGCYVMDGGGHHGQIAVTINEESCDDTYYGCINTTTGQFQLVIPDDCCIEYSSNDCECFDPDKTPLYVFVTIAGVSGCSSIGICVGHDCGAINGSYTLTQDPGWWPSNYGDCYWNTDGYPFVQYSSMAKPYYDYQSSLTCNNPASRGCFRGRDASRCVTSFSNDLVCLEGGTLNAQCGYGGTAIVTFG